MTFDKTPEQYETWLSGLSEAELYVEFDYRWGNECHDWENWMETRGRDFVEWKLVDNYSADYFIKQQEDDDRKFIEMVESVNRRLKSERS